MGFFGVWKAIMSKYRHFWPFLGHFFSENFGKFLGKFWLIFLEKVGEKTLSRGGTHGCLKNGPKDGPRKGQNFMKIS